MMFFQYFLSLFFFGDLEDQTPSRPTKSKAEFQTAQGEPLWIALDKDKFQRIFVNKRNKWGETSQNDIKNQT